MSESPAGFSGTPRRTAAEPPFAPSAGRAAQILEGILRAIGGVGTSVLALVAGRKRARTVVAVDAILGAAISGGALALGAWLVGWRRVHPADAVEVGAGIGACVGTVLHLLNMALEDHAKEKTRRWFGDN
jgi:hypothetical protein